MRVSMSNILIASISIKGVWIKWCAMRIYNWNFEMKSTDYETKKIRWLSFLTIKNIGRCFFENQMNKEGVLSIHNILCHSTWVHSLVKIGVLLHAKYVPLPTYATYTSESMTFEKTMT